MSSTELNSTQHFYDTSLANESASLQYLLLELDSKSLKFCTYHLTKSKMIGFSVFKHDGLVNSIEKLLTSEQQLHQNFEQTIVTYKCINYVLVPRTYLGTEPEVIFGLTNEFDDEKEILLSFPLVNLRANVLYTIPKDLHNMLKNGIKRMNLIPHIAPRVEQELNAKSSKENDKISIHLSHERMDVLVFQKDKLTLSNSFYIGSIEDVGYYVLFCAQSLNVDPEKAILTYSGSLNEEVATLDLLTKYWKNTEMAELLSNVKVNASMPEYPKHELDYLTQGLLCAL